MGIVKEDLGLISGAGKVPFTATPYNSRVNISSQNCYLYDDNGQLKAHVELTATTTESIAADYAIMKGFPSSTSVGQTVDSGRYKLFNSTNLILFNTVNSISSGQTLNLNFDYTV